MLRNTSGIIRHTCQFAQNWLAVIFFLNIFLVAGCSTDDEPAPSPKTDQFLLSSSEIVSLSQSQLLQFVQLGGFSDFSDFITNGIEVYRVTYQTTYREEKIEASGLVVIPDDTSQPIPLLSAQHGTIFSNAAAPSEFSIVNGVSGFELFSAAGFISIIPDFIGYGSSKEILHPYYNFKHTGGAIIDMILAAKEFLDRQSIPYNNKLFLAGYSEGGYATVAAQKAIEADPDLGLSVTAVAAGAGGYDIVGVMENILDRDNYDSPAYLTFITYAAITTNQWNRPLTDFFQEPYASNIPGLLDGSLSQSEVNSALTENTSELFNPDLLIELRKGTNNILADELALNSVHDWTPKAPLRLYHSAADNIIPIGNSKNTANLMNSNGASDVTFIEVGGNSHGAAVLPMLENAIPWFISLK